MIGKCAGCEAKEKENAYLRELLDKRDRAYLALVDLRAHNVVHPREAKEPASPSPEPTPTSPEQMRNTLWSPPVTDAQVERLFQLERDLESEGTS